MNKAMKRNRLLVFKINTIKTILKFVLLQLIILLVFIQAGKNSIPIDIKDTKQKDIIVSDTYCLPLGKFHNDYLLVVDNEETEYMFADVNSASYSERELEKLISKGDRLLLTYYEGKILLFIKVNIIVDARTQTQVYLTLDEYNEGRAGAPAIIVLFSIIEFLFICFTILYFNVNFGMYTDDIKRIHKIKNTYIKQNKNRK